MKNKFKKIIPLMMCFMLVIGSCMFVNAASTQSLIEGEIPSIKGGDTVLQANGFYHYGNDLFSLNNVSLKINSVEGESPVYCFTTINGLKTDGNDCRIYTYFVSRNIFTLNLDYVKDTERMADNINQINYTCNVSSSDKWGDWYVAGYTPNFPLSFNHDGSLVSNIILDISAYNDSNNTQYYDGVPFAHYKVDMIFGYREIGGDVIISGTLVEGNGSKEPSLSEGSMNTALGYLSNITYSQYIEKNSEGFPVNAKYVVGWDNNHSDWDDSYRVAHYIKVRADIKTLGNSTKSMYSDMIFVDDVSFSSVKSSFLNSDLTSTDAYNSFISEVKEQSNVLTDFPYTTGYIHYLIIYHETDNGIQYGYWNQITSDDFENSSIGKVPGYGIIDNDGNYVEIEDFGRLEDYEIGVGDSIEDAENNKETVTPNFDVLPSIKNIDDFMQYFQEMMASLFETIGSLPKYVAEFFSFLPAPIIVCLTMGVLIAIILRIVGR